MKILNPQVRADIDKGKPIKLDLGSGGYPQKGFYSVDYLELDGVDIIANLNEPLDLLPDNSVEYVYSRHTLEHVHHLLPLIQEIYRITQKEGIIEIIVPHFSNVYGYSDPTHVRFFGLYSMYYFVSPENQPDLRKVPSFYTDVRFIVNSIKLQFYRYDFIDKLFADLISKVVNRNIYWQNFYKRRLSNIFHAWQIRYLMRPVK